MRSGFWSRGSIILQVFLAVVTEFSGLVAFVYYLLQRSYQPATWGFMTSFFALVVIHLHILFLKNDLDDWYEPEAFDPIKYLSLIVSFAALVTIGINFYFGYQNQERKFDLQKLSNFQSCNLFVSLTFFLQNSTLTTTTLCV